ncbi:MAG: chromosome partitioning protein [Specibacter sp.]
MNIVSVVSVGDTATGVIDELAASPGKLSIVRRCPELAQLLAACQSGLAQVAVVAQCAGDLTATLVDRLTAVGVSVVAVADSPEDARRLRNLGASVVSGNVSAELLGAAVLGAVESRRHHLSTGFAVPDARESGPAGGVIDGSAGDASPSRSEPERVRSSTAVPGAQGHSNSPPSPSSLGARPRDSGRQDVPAYLGGPPPPGPAAPQPVRPHMSPAGIAAKVRARLHREQNPQRSRRGHQKAATQKTGKQAPGPGTTLPQGGGSTLVAVWGPTGSPGRTTVAINLAAEQAASGRSVMLIDADSFGASIAAALGLLDESASFAQACRVADQGQLNVAQLSRISTQVVFSGGAFSLLTGLTRPDRWPELRAAAVQRVLLLAKEMADLVIVDCGFSLESDEELSYDTVAPRRNAATLMVLSQADIIYALGSSDPVGIPRLIRGLAELAQHCPGADVRVVVNKVRRRAVGGAPERALAQAWERFGPPLPIKHFLPWEPELTDKALLEGRLLQEIAPDAPLRKAIRDISCAAVQRNPESAVRNATAKLEVQR